MSDHHGSNHGHGGEDRPKPHKPLAFLFMCMLGGMVFMIGLQYLLPLIWLGLVFICLAFILFYF